MLPQVLPPDLPDPPAFHTAHVLPSAPPLWVIFFLLPPLPFPLALPNHGCPSHRPSESMGLCLPVFAFLTQCHTDHSSSIHLKHIFIGVFLYRKIYFWNIFDFYFISFHFISISIQSSSFPYRVWSHTKLVACSVPCSCLFPHPCSYPSTFSKYLTSFPFCCLLSSDLPTPMFMAYSPASEPPYTSSHINTHEKHLEGRSCR